MSGWTALLLAAQPTALPPAKAAKSVRPDRRPFLEWEWHLTTVPVPVACPLDGGVADGPCMAWLLARECSDGSHQVVLFGLTERGLDPVNVAFSRN